MVKQDTGVCKGIPYIDLHEHLDGFTLIKTTEGNIDTFLGSGDSNEEIKKVMLPRIIQKRIGYPLDKEFKQIVTIKSLKHCPVTVDDISNATIIRGLHNRNRLKEAATRCKPNSRVKIEDRVKIRRDQLVQAEQIRDLNNGCHVYQWAATFVALLRKLKSVTAEYVPNKKVGQLAQSPRKIVKLYAIGGFIVRLALKQESCYKVCGPKPEEIYIYKKRRFTSAYLLF